MGHSQRKINSEITKMLRAYEALIADPEKECEKWRDYGSFLTCRMCKLFARSFNDKNDICIDCPLCRPVGLIGWATPCVENGVPGDTHDALYEAVREGYVADGYDGYWATPVDIKKVRKAAKARYKWILKRLKGNGYEYK